MTTRRELEGGGYRWWSYGGGVSQPGGGIYQNQWFGHELPAIGGYHLQEVTEPYQWPGNQTVYLDVLQMSNPKRRLRWSPELHEKFVKAIDQLGGASKATPKKISMIMGVEGLTLFQIKSHLQKFRLSKTAKTMAKGEFPPSNSDCREDEKLLPQPVNLECNGSSVWNAFDGNIGNVTEADMYGNLHLLVEPHTAVKNKETAITYVNLEEEVAATKPALQPFYPPIQTELPHFLDGGGEIPVAPCAFDNVPMDDSLISSSEFASTKSHESGRASTALRSVLDEIARYLNVDYDNQC